MAETSEPQASASTGSGEGAGAGGEEDKRDERMLECNICLDTARDAVVSMCGHLFWYADSSQPLAATWPADYMFEGQNMLILFLIGTTHEYLQFLGTA